MPYFIHVHDPTFFEDPWPGQRRIGPINSIVQALEQAASDVAGGAGEGVLGIFTGTASDSMRQEDVRVAHLVGVNSEDLPPERRGPLSDIDLFARAQDRKWVESLVDAEPSKTVEQIRARADAIIAERDANLNAELETLKQQIISTFPESMTEQEKDEAALATMKLTRMIY